MEVLPPPPGWDLRESTRGFSTAGPASPLQRAGLGLGAAERVAVTAPLGPTPHPSDEESGKLSQLAVPTGCRSVQTLGLAVPRPWGPSQPSVPPAPGSQVPSLVSGPSCPNICLGGTGFSVPSDYPLHPWPTHPNPAWRGLGSCLPPPTHPGPHLGTGTDRALTAVTPGGLLRRQLICFTLGPLPY